MDEEITILQTNMVLLPSSHVKLAREALDKGLYMEALTHFQTSLNHQKEVYGEVYSQNSDLLLEIGRIYIKFCQYNKALDTLHEALQIKEKFVESNSYEFVPILNEIGEIEIYLTRYTKASQRLDGCLHILANLLNKTQNEMLTPSKCT